MKHVYILQSINAPERHYTGVTEGTDVRISEHNRLKCTHTRKFAPWKLVVSVAFEDDTKAYAFERYLKSGSGRAFAKRHF